MVSTGWILPRIGQMAEQVGEGKSNHLGLCAYKTNSRAFCHPREGRTSARSNFQKVCAKKPKTKDHKDSLIGSLKMNRLVNSWIGMCLNSYLDIWIGIYF